jgi:phosphoribosylaminoimidazole-succinocarboxamide synthase
MQKNEKLEENILTPTTKSADHDLPVSGNEIVEQGLMSKEDFQEVHDKALALFAFGQEVALKHGLLLVDTKYEFGKASDGSILLIDEVHTPDSSRYWIAASYEERQSQGMEPENIDKEFLRLWFRNNCDPYHDKVLPNAPEELVAELAWRYIVLYETITGTQIQLPGTKEPVHDRISRNVQQALLQLQ